LVAHLPWEQGVAGSNPVIPILKYYIFIFIYFLFF
jgi:hypothetical protein